MYMCFASSDEYFRDNLIGAPRESRQKGATLQKGATQQKKGDSTKRRDSLLRLPVGRGGVLNSPRFCFFFGVRSRRSAHG